MKPARKEVGGQSQVLLESSSKRTHHSASELPTSLAGVEPFVAGVDSFQLLRRCSSRCRFDQGSSLMARLENVKSE